MPTVLPEKQRLFALEIVQRLRRAGFEAYWAGGCVRDQLLGRTPKDYDVATDATPRQIHRLFPRRRTLDMGAAFGVVTILGRRGSGQVEVATFRSDATYSDGRHPDSVTFSTAEEDAARRDFTINGLFFDPVKRQVIDFVGGREDLERRVVRAIGQPLERFGEDKLRMLRAVRFAATLDFTLEQRTLGAIRRMAAQITVVSRERVAVEMRRILVDCQRGRGVRLLLETGLAAAILPELVPADDAGSRRLDHTLAMLERLHEPSFPLTLAVLLGELVDADGAEQVCRRWRLSNKENHRVWWLVEHRGALFAARTMRRSALLRLLVAEGIEELLALEESVALIDGSDTDEVAYCRSLLERPRETLDPPPLLTGDDLLAAGVAPGPQYGELLERVRNAQLDEEIHTKADALALVDRLTDEVRAKKG